MFKKGLDEMQTSNRNKIGNQSFLIILYLLLIDAGLYGFGVRWLAYPANIMVILIAASAYYQLRIIWNNAYIAPSSTPKKSTKKTITIIIIASTCGILASLILKQYVNTDSIDSDDNGALILFIVSSVFLVISLLAIFIRNKMNKDNEK